MSEDRPYTRRLEVGPLILTRYANVAEIRVKGEHGWRTEWPTYNISDPFPTPAEEMAQALAVLDGRFEVRHRSHRP